MIQRYGQFWFFRKGPGNSFPTTFCVWFFKENVSYIIWRNSIAGLPLVLEILANISVTNVCFPGCDVINFEINLTFLIKPFLYTTKKSGQKFKYFDNEKDFKVKQKAFFIICIIFIIKDAKNCLRPETASLILRSLLQLLSLPAS